MGRVVNLHAPSSPPEAGDLALIEACRRGDRAALERVFTAHAPYVERVLHRVVGRTLPVEDLLQSTFVAAIQAFPRFRGEAHVRTWLARIAVHTAQDRLRSAEQRKRADLPDLETLAAVDPAADTALDRRRHLARLEFHLNALGPKKRIAFVLHVFEGMPMEEVAALMGAGVAATKSRVFWARRELFRRAKRDPILCELAEGAEP